MLENRLIPTLDLLKLAYWTIKFPSDKILKQHLALKILDILTAHQVQIPPELISCLFQSENDMFLNIIGKEIEFLQ